MMEFISAQFFLFVINGKNFLLQIRLNFIVKGGEGKLPEFKDKFHLTPEQSIFLAKRNGMRIYIVE